MLDAENDMAKSPLHLPRISVDLVDSKTIVKKNPRMSLSEINGFSAVEATQSPSAMSEDARDISSCLNRTFQVPKRLSLASVNGPTSSGNAYLKLSAVPAFDPPSMKVRLSFGVNRERATLL